MCLTFAFDIMLCITSYFTKTKLEKIINLVSVLFLCFNMIEEKRPFDFEFFARLLEKVLADEEKRKQKTVKSQRPKEKKSPRSQKKSKGTLKESLRRHYRAVVSNVLLAEEKSHRASRFPCLLWTGLEDLSFIVLTFSSVVYLCIGW